MAFQNDQYYLSDPGTHTRIEFLHSKNYSKPFPPSAMDTSRKDYDTLYSPQGPGYPGLPIPAAAPRQRFLLRLSAAAFVVVPLVPIAILLWYILCQSSYAVHGIRLYTGGRANTILLLTQLTSKVCSLLIPSVMASQAWVAAASWSRGQRGRMQHEKPTPLQYVFLLLKRVF